VELDARSAPARDERAVARLVGAAAGGTLYVRAADALPGAAQRVLRDTLDANGESADAPPRRVIVASVRPLDALPVDGALRERLASLAVELPPLRDRVGDVAALTEVFVRQLGGASPPVVTSAAADRLERHPWPGNVAELRLVLEGAVARAVDGVVGPAHLLLDPPTPPPSAL
jgi:transcriptional regulator of acetoin/glycerol metabolism